MKKIKIILLILIVLVSSITIYWKIPGSPEKVKFQKAMQKRANEAEKRCEVCSRKEIEQLPEPLKKYCEYIGLENFPKYQVVNVVFNDTDFVFDTKSGKIISMDYDLWLFYGDVFRSAFCSSSMYFKYRFNRSSIISPRIFNNSCSFSLFSSNDSVSRHQTLTFRTLHILSHPFQITN